MKKNSFFKIFTQYYNSLSILKKFLIPSITGFMFFLLFYIYILSSTTSMKENVHQINSELIPIYETIFDNEIQLEKISSELNNAVIANELQWIDNSEVHAKKIRANINKYINSSYEKELTNLYTSFNEYYKEASLLSKILIENNEQYENIHHKTAHVVKKYNELIILFQNFREHLKQNIKNNINSSYKTSSMIVFNSSYAFIAWIIISSLGLLYIYKDIKKRINQIVKQSESIAVGEANFHKRLTSKSDDELGLVVNSINSFISKLEKNHNELEYVKDDIKKFIEDTAHQIRTPLSSILINTEMIKDQQKDDSLHSLFDSIDASINMLSNSYEDLLYITSYDSIEYHPSYISLSDLLNKRIDFFETVCKANFKNIQADIIPDIFIYMNPIECERVIDNNISNAVKYAYIDQAITINLYESKELNKIILEFKSHADEIEKKDKIFNKNYREDDSKRGLGLGLNMVRDICNKNSILYKVEYINGQNVFTYTFEPLEKRDIQV